MPKSKNRKKHKQKVANRNQKLREQKNKVKQFQDNFFKQMMEEANDGAFDDENVKELPNGEGDSTTQESVESIEASEEDANEESKS